MGEKLDDDFDFGNDFVEDIVPEALEYYLGYGDDELGDSDEDDEHDHDGCDSHGGGEDSDSDGDVKPKKGKKKGGKNKGGGKEAADGTGGD